jgi:UDP-N-acetylmuramate: L-alanyl-gamma-D-glutamyl-meso-diaminopimelate ligase
MGRHNARNTLAALALATEGAGASLAAALEALPSFRGVRRRQELIGVADGVRVYDDFAHHPTAVRETIASLRSRHREGRLLAVFEPRSATSSRRLHQDEYPDAFRAADEAWFAPVGRPEIADAERLDVNAIADRLTRAGTPGHAAGDIDSIVREVTSAARPGDTIVVMSNGPFGGIHDKILSTLTTRVLDRRAHGPRSG